MIVSRVSCEESKLDRDLVLILYVVCQYCICVRCDAVVWFFKNVNLMKVYLISERE